MKYLVYYDTPANKGENRNYVLAAAEKIDYICRALNQVGQKVELISASGSCNRKCYRGKTVQISDQIRLKLFPSLGTGSLPRRLLSRMLLRTGLFLYLLFHLKKGENLLVYHSLGYAGMVRLLRKLRDFRLILEVEEIYADVSGQESERKKEFRLFSAADAFLFSTELLNGKINTENKPYVLAHGTYQAEPVLGSNVFAGSFPGEKRDRIHCVYAGTFDPRKGGAMAAVAAAEFLPEHYHLHILGFGDQKQTAQLTELIQRIAKKCMCRITYDGLLQGEAYIRFLQSCDIGLSTHNPDAAFNGTSFPSKILSYMANGLRVVSIRIPAVVGSDIGAYLYYYDQQTPEAIAQAIMQVDLTDSYDGRKILENLNEQFVKELEQRFPAKR